MIYNVTGGTYDGGSVDAPTVEVGSTVRIPIQRERDNFGMTDVTDISYFVEVYHHEDIGDLKFLHYS